MTTPNPPAFRQAITEYLAPHRQQFNYDAMLHTFTDNERFRRWAAYADRLQPVVASRFLSSGCGMGGSLLAYHDAGAASVTGVEPDPLYVRLAGLRVADVPTAEVRRVAADPPLPFTDGAFDLIESMDVIEHVPDPLAYLADLIRVLAPDGLILLVTPNRLWPIEQHLGITGPPWLPVGLADGLFTGLSRIPGLGEERRFKYSKLAGIRTQNMSLLRLSNLANALHARLDVLHPDEEDTFPLPPEQPRSAQLLRHPLGRFVAPVKTLAVAIRHS